MKLHQLRALDAVARLGGIRAAAREMGLTQPALTKALRELEEANHLKLLVRGHRGASLTDAGTRLVIHGRAIFRELEAAQIEMLQMAGDKGGHVSFGISPMLGQVIIPEAYRAFRTRFPNVRLRMHEAFTRETIAWVADGTIDFAVVLLLGSEASANITTQPWFDVDHKVVGRLGHPLGQRATFEDLHAQEWLITNASGGGQFDLLTRLCAENGMALPERIIEIPSLNLLQTMLHQTDAVAISPILTRAPSGDKAQIIECDAVHGLRRQFGLIRKADSQLGAAAEAMRDEVFRLSHRIMQDLKAHDAKGSFRSDG